MDVRKYEIYFSRVRKAKEWDILFNTRNKFHICKHACIVLFIILLLYFYYSTYTRTHARTHARKNVIYLFYTIKIEKVY